jgi:hypothetical protein
LKRLEPRPGDADPPCLTSDRMDRVTDIPQYVFGTNFIGEMFPASHSAWVFCNDGPVRKSLATVSHAGPSISVLPSEQVAVT